MHLFLSIIPAAVLISSAFAAPGPVPEPEVTPLPNLEKRQFNGPPGCPARIAIGTVSMPGTFKNCHETKTLSYTYDCGFANGCTQGKLFSVTGRFYPVNVNSPAPQTGHLYLIDYDRLQTGLRDEIMTG
ncbi:hypothetical protein TWF281_009760 [Arthrobotrys megalospora]